MPRATHNLPRIGVAANPDWTGKLCFESWEGTKSAREYEVEKTPQLAQVVLDRGSRQDETVHRPDLLTDKCHLKKTHTKTRIKGYNFEETKS